jgi:hypothetical protein
MLAMASPGAQGGLTGASMGMARLPGADPRITDLSSARSRGIQGRRVRIREKVAYAVAEQTNRRLNVLAFAADSDQGRLAEREAVHASNSEHDRLHVHQDAQELHATGKCVARIRASRQGAFRSHN